ncbi:hypothetical protein SRHO_G00304310 [Serrasalmus rhombeus]
MDHRPAQWQRFTKLQRELGQQDYHQERGYLHLIYMVVTLLRWEEGKGFLMPGLPQRANAGACSRIQK